MASLVKRGTRSAPKWFVKWDVRTVDGTKQKWKLLPGILTAPDAHGELVRVERALSKGMDPFPLRIEPTAAEGLFLKWTGTGKPVLDGQGNPKTDASGEALIDLGELRNRNAANDRGMVRKHLIPRFGRMTLEQITLREVMDWLREMRDAKTLSPQTQRHCLATLSRFWGWCVLWNHTTLPNPCRSVPTAIKPVVVHAKRATLEDESKLAELIAALPDPVNMMLALANRTGLRLGEVCGLRLSDLDTIPKGFLTVSHSYANPLKEDRRGVGKVKKAPAPVDVAEALKMHVARRRLQGAGPDDLLFVPTKTSKRPRANDWRGFKKENIRDLWWAACKTAKLVDDEGKPTVTWYGSTRTTQGTRAAKADVPIEQISKSLGHASTEITEKHYVQFQREDFHPALRLPMLPLLAPKKKTGAKG